MADDIAPPPRLTLTPIALPGQPATDKGFVTADGTKIRVRIVVARRDMPSVDATGAVSIAPSGYVFHISSALLDADLDVAKDGAGNLLIMDHCELNMDATAMANPGFTDPAAAVQEAIEQDAYRLKQRLATSAAVTDYFMSSWGMTLSSSDEAPGDPRPTATVPTTVAAASPT